MSTSQTFNSSPTAYSSPSHPPRPPTSSSQRESLRLNHDVYLVDFNVFRPPEELRLRIEEISDAWNINACTEINRQINEEKARAALEGSGGSSSIHSIDNDETIKKASIDGNREEEGVNINGLDNKSRHIKNSAKEADGISNALPVAAEPSGPAEEETNSATDSKELKTVSASVSHPPQEMIKTLSGVKVFAQKGMSMEEALSVVEFQKKIFEKSGLGENNTFLPKSIHPKYCGENPRTDLEAAGQECFMATTGALRGLFERTKLRPSDIDIIVTTCSIYCPTPSMASMLVNAFSLKSSIQSYHLAGMGCGNGVIAINLVSDLLKARPQGANAILVTTETTTPAFYRGADKHRLVTNVLFRMGAAAILLSNKSEMRQRAKYRLTHKVRVHTSASEDSYRCIWYGPDEQGINGIYLGKNIVKEAGRGVTLALRHIAPYAMSWGEIGRFVSLQVQEAFRNGRREGRGARQAAEVGEIGKGHLATTPSLPDNPSLPNHPNAANTTTTTTTATTTTNHASSDKDEDPLSTPPPKRTSSSNTSTLKSFRPKFNESINHFLVHAGGAKVLDGLGKELRLEERDLIPSRAVLHDYGNVSSSTTWYTLAYIESCRGVAAGERVLQVGVGSGVKCGVNLWTALRDIDDVHEAWEHREETRTSRDVKTAVLPKQLSVSAKDSERINAKDGIVNPSPKKDDFEKLVETNAHYYQGSATSASLRMRRRGIYKFPNVIAAYDYARPYIRLLCIIALAILVIMYFRNGRLSGGDGHSGLFVKQQVSEMQRNQDVASSLVDKGMKRMAYDWRVSGGEDGGKGKDEVLQMVRDTLGVCGSGGGGSEVAEELGKSGAVLHPDL